MSSGKNPESGRLTAVSARPGQPRLGKFETGDLIGAQPEVAAGKVPALAVLLGIGVGLIGVAFLAASHWLAVLLLTRVAGLPGFGAEVAPDSAPVLWALVVIPAAGGLLLAAWYFVTRDRTGGGTEVVINAYHNGRGELSPWLVAKKFVASTLSLGTGAAGGREGPIALMGGAAGSWLAGRFGLSVRERRVLLVAGLAAGIGGMFRTPLAGGLLAAEILYSDSEFEPDVLIPSILASVASYCVFGLVVGWDPIFGRVAPDYVFSNPIELIPLTLLAAGLVLGGYLYVRIHHTAQGAAKRLPRWLKPAVGGALSGGLAVGLILLLKDSHGEAFHSLMGDGYEFLGSLFRGGSDATIWWVLLAVAVGKMLTSALTVGTGNAAGNFAPSMVIGGCLGAGLGLLMGTWMPAAAMPEGGALQAAPFFALVGMAGYYAGISKAPIAAVIIVSELTGSYNMLLPAIWVCSLTFLLSGWFKLHHQQVSSRLKSPAHMGDFAANVLKEITVLDVLGELGNFESVSEGTSLREILAMRATRQSYYPVVTKAGKFVGVFSLNDVRAVLGEQDVWQLLVAADIAHRSVLTVHPSETLADVSLKFAQTTLDELPVVEDGDEQRLIGIISRRQLNNAYIRRMLEFEAARKDTAGAA